jgi:hypothetical protein
MKPVCIRGYDLSERIRRAGLMIVLLLVSVSAVSGQQVRQEKPPLRERLFFGGNVGLMFGSYTNIDISPIVGLWVLPRLAVGAGPDFRYYKDPYGSTTIYGGKVYTEIVFLQDLNNILPLGIHLGLFLHGEYEGLSLESAFFKNPPYESERFMLNTFLAGGGIRQMLGPRSAMNITFLWAFDDSGYGIYGNPEIRISFMF